MLQNIGTTEVIIICLILILLFGGKRIPAFIRSLGDSVNEFKKASKGEPAKKDTPKE